MLDKLNLLEMILTYDQEGRITSANQQALGGLGYTDEEIKSMRLDDIFVGEAASLESTRMASEDSSLAPSPLALINEPQEITNMLAYRKNRTCFPVFVRMQPAGDEAGGNYLLALNIQSQSNLEKEILTLKIEAEEHLKSRNEFIANMTHELRTPVNGIRGHISALLHDSINASDRKTFTIIQKCCEDMSYIINNILDFSKLEAGKFELIHEVFDLYELLNHIVTANLAVINEKGIRIILNIADNVPREVYGDGVRIKQILNNLVANAVKFTDIGHVSIDVNKHGQHADDIELFFLVRDTGIGIAPEHRDKLFKSFSQIDGSSTRKYGGTGLGLMITKELVELMGGSIRVESNPGKGSNFSFNIRLKVLNHLMEEQIQSIDSVSQQAVPQENHPSVLPPTQPHPSASLGGQNVYENFLKNLTFDPRDVDSVYQYGTPENFREIRKKCRVLVIALELEAWGKAETISENMKKLVQDGPDDLKKNVFRLGMAIRKEEEEKSRKLFTSMMEKLEAM